MAKKKNTPLNIFMESVGLYFSNFDKFFKYMTFAVLGQVLGLSLVFLLLFFFTKNMPVVIEKVPALSNLPTLLVIAILVILPGMIIFLKAFWEYLVAYGAINSMFENMIKSGKVYDFDAHTELIKRRSLQFIGLWMMFGIFSAVGSIPFFWVVYAVFVIYFVLVFQVFTFEPEMSPIGCVKRSLQLVKGHFLQTLVLFALAGALTYVLIPQLINMFCDYTRLSLLFNNLILPIVKELPLGELNTSLSYLYLPPLQADKISTFFVGTFIAQVVIQYTLPLRSILWAMWYKELNGGKLYLNNDDKPKFKKKRSVKRPSEKLMEESHKKFATKKIDRNILKRATEKGEE